MDSNKFKFIPTMVFHQIHYFSYCYVVPYLFFIMLKNYGYSDLDAGLLDALSIVISWMIYLSPQEILTKLIKKINYFNVFLAGHCLLALIMTAMFWTCYMKMYIPFVILWCLTGFGGGTVFCIQHISSEYEKVDMKFSEDLGHVLGTIVSICIGICFIDNILLLTSICCLTASIFVCLTIGFGIFDHFNNMHRECT